MLGSTRGFEMPFRNSAHCVDRQTMVLLEDGIAEETIEDIIPMWDVYYDLNRGNATAEEVLASEDCRRIAEEPMRLLSIDGNAVYPAVRFRFDNPPDCLIKLTVEDGLDPDPGRHSLLLTDKHTVVVLNQRMRPQQPCENPGVVENLRDDLLFLLEGDPAAAAGIRRNIADHRLESRTYLTAVDFETGICVERKNGRLGEVAMIEAPEHSGMICSLVVASDDKRGDITPEAIRDLIPIDMQKNMADPLECQWLPLDINGVLARMPFMEYFNNWYDHVLLRRHTAFDNDWIGLAPPWPLNLQLPDPRVWGLTGGDHAIFGNGNGNGTLTLQRMHHHKTIVDYSLAEIWQP